MPLRCVIPRAAHILRYSSVRSIHSSPSFRSDDVDARKNHYEALNLPSHASPAEIKSSFYALSKAHHPDHNRHDPNASRKFMRISEAYSVLGTPAKRAAYDRDVLRLHQHDHHAHGRRGSYHSTGPAGGRTASGLSRRRGTYQGPPPSFYRSGGWGRHAEKRKGAHEDSTGGAGTAEGAPSGASAGAGTQAGMGPGQDPYGHRDDVPYFDAESHTSTHRKQDERRAWRSRDMDDSDLQPGSLVSGFFIITGVLAVGVLIPIMIMSGAFSRKKRKDTG